MFITYFAKTILIILQDTAFLLLSLSFTTYIKNMLSPAHHDKSKSIAFVAKILVFMINLVLLVGIAISLYFTHGWQKSLAVSIWTAVLQEPVFGLLMIALVFYPVFYVGRLVATKNLE